jgi:hypothetical protein
MAPYAGQLFLRLTARLPFGFRLERNSRSGTTGQVLAALAFGSIGTLAIGVLDLAVGGDGAPPLAPQDIVASLATVALSHYAASALGLLAKDGAPTGPQA